MKHLELIWLSDFRSWFWIRNRTQSERSDWIGKIYRTTRSSREAADSLPVGWSEAPCCYLPATEAAALRSDPIRGRLYWAGSGQARQAAAQRQEALDESCCCGAMATEMGWKRGGGRTMLSRRKLPDQKRIQLPLQAAGSDGSDQIGKELLIQHRAV